MKTLRTLNNLVLLPTLATAIVMSALNSSAAVGSISVYNTGVGISGLLGNNVADPHYSLVSAPAPYTSAMTGDGANDWAWLPDGPNSRWIGVTPWLAEWVPVGTYVYRTTFNLTGFDPSTASLQLSLASDNACRVLLNGADTGIITGSEAFTAFSELIITNGFVAGLNTLDFAVDNASTPGAPTHNPTGLRVELSGYATVVPEPGVMSMAGIAALVLVARRGKKAN